jgi:hypothetical protein
MSKMGEIFSVSRLSCLSEARITERQHSWTCRRSFASGLLPTSGQDSRDGRSRRAFVRLCSLFSAPVRIPRPYCAFVIRHSFAGQKRVSLPCRPNRAVQQTIQIAIEYAKCRKYINIDNERKKRWNPIVTERISARELKQSTLKLRSLSPSGDSPICGRAQRDNRPFSR